MGCMIRVCLESKIRRFEIGFYLMTLITIWQEYCHVLNLNN
jgi:hypothetical protein